MILMLKNLLFNSTNIYKQLLFPIGHPNCTLSTFPECGVGGIVQNTEVLSSLKIFTINCIDIWIKELSFLNLEDPLQISFHISKVVFARI